MKILFLDHVTPKPYSLRTLQTEPMGGSESTVVRIAEALAGLGHTVYAAQHCRRDLEATRVVYTEVTPQLLSAKWDRIVLIRSAKNLPWLARTNPDAKFYVQMTDLGNVSWLHDEVEIIDQYKPTVICVSDYHKTQMQEALAVLACHPQMRFIYNPIADDLVKDETPVDMNKMVFFSSPHKGLEQALCLFTAARRVMPDLKLHIANPGYMPLASRNLPEGVVYLGPLANHAVIKHVRSAVCTFHPNHVFPETFGIVTAESMAVGTPVLTHMLGAAWEVLGGDTRCLVDTRSVKEVINRLLLWTNGNRPDVSMRPEFRLREVVKEWTKLLAL